MAVTLIVEDGSGVTGGNSYVTLVEANEYIEANAFAYTSWSALTDDERNALLVWATRYVEARVDWEGYKVYPANVLSWPREGVIDHEGNAVDNDVVPYRVKAATIEMARFLIDNDRSAPGAREGISRIKADVIELEFDPDFKQMTIPDDVIALLRGYGRIQNPTGITFGKVRRA